MSLWADRARHMDVADYRGFDVPEEWPIGPGFAHPEPWTFGQPHQGFVSEASKIDWLMNRPDKFKETPTGQSYLGWMQQNPQYDQLFPWMWTQGRKGNLAIDQQTGQPSFTQEQGMLNEQGLANYWSAYENEYGFQPHWLKFVNSPQDFAAIHADPENQIGSNDVDNTYAYDQAVRQLQEQPVGQIGGQQFELWKKWREPTDPVDPQTLDRWSAFAKDKQHPVRQEAGNIDEHTPESFDALSKQWDFERNNGKVIDTLPNGWTVRQLENGQDARYEGQQMGHCVGSYGDHIENGDSLIYSLRDKQNRPHTTFEIAPEYSDRGLRSVDVDKLGHMTPEEQTEFWQNFQFDPQRVKEINESLAQGLGQNAFENWGERNKFKQLSREFPGELHVFPYGGQMVQIQGKEDSPPIEKYEKMLKHHFLNYYGEDDRPRWEDQEISDLDDLQKHYSDDYENGNLYRRGFGLQEPDVSTDWERIADDIASNAEGSYHGVDEDDADLLAKHAVEHGHADPLLHYLSQQNEEQREHFMEQAENDVDRNFHDYEDHNPSPDEEDFRVEDEDGYPTDKIDHDAHQEAYDKWLEERDENYREAVEDRQEELLSESPWNELYNTVDSSVRSELRRRRRDANPWYQPLLDTLQVNYQDRPQFGTEQAREMFLKAKESDSVPRLRSALREIPTGRWDSGHHALMAHLDHHLGQPTARTAAKLHDFLMNPKSRPDLQTPGAKAFVQTLNDRYWSEKTDPLMPWLAREWKKGRILHRPDTNAIGYDEDPNSDMERRRVITPERLNHWADFYGSNHPIRRNLGDLMKSQVSIPATWKHHHTGEIYTGPRDHPNDERLPDPDVHHFPDMVNSWDQAMQDEARQQALQNAEITHQYPDGWSLQNLREPDALKAEGDAMGHCVGGYCDHVRKGRSMIYSLRDPSGTPHVTMEMQPTKGEPDFSPEALSQDPLWGSMPQRLQQSILEHHQGIPPEQWTYRDYPAYDKAPEPNYALPGSEEMGRTGVIPAYEAWKVRVPHIPDPENAQVVQIQGRGNSQPKDEYKARLRDWFHTFPPETRPTHQYDDGEVDGMHDEEGYWHSTIDHPDLIPEYEERHGSLAPRSEPREDEYGLLHQPTKMEADYDSLLNNIRHNDYGYYNTPHAEHIDNIYRLAKERGEIPQLTSALEGYSERQEESFEDWMHMNHEYAPRFVDPDDPHGWMNAEGEEVEEEHPHARPFWQPNMSEGEHYTDPDEAETAYDDAYGEWERQHSGMAAASAMYKYIAPHWNPATNAYDAPNPQPPTFT